MTRRPSTKIQPSEITPPEVFFNRRQVIAGALAAGAVGFAQADERKLQYTRNAQYSVKETPNSFEDISSYNNFYEFGTDKSDPKANAQDFRTEPWTVTVDGEAEVKGKFTLEDILKPHPLEERIYRFRCVEAWSMVVPWLGFPLADLVKRFKPTSKARYVQFTTLYDPKQMPGQRYPILDWPYVEGLRMDEAMHPLTLMVVGVYGKVLPNQNGAPLRLIVPWKYGFKSCKSIAKISFVERQPRTAWNVATPHEYGFYANVNPAVDHPRWSQATERRIGGGFFAKRINTLPFNGYADQVASLYKGMDLTKFF
ncbi:MAG TPA: protein-methionine-sulfoxide reductase catalytic subunit MsrP [Steroidobacteraceae bacterium]|jgi:sulfoxide reductase catalytic subunit YedY|nr:protein-methionine-sulfoxide reductase catalytic subunit MsrP [Steroidobacteraceae bacterium]